jgi:hypothetical protein
MWIEGEDVAACARFPALETVSVIQGRCVIMGDHSEGE